MDIDEILKANNGILLDIGCGNNKQRGFIGMDIRKLPNVDIVWNLEEFPCPLPENSCITIVASHIIEHIKPWLQINFMDELWRIMKPEGQLLISAPYGWSSGFIQDPTHCKPVNEATFQYYDPAYPLYNIYEPNPWEIQDGMPVWSSNGNIEVIMRKIAVPVKKYKQDKLKKLEGKL